MEAYKRFSTAKKAANGEPILRVGDLYLVGIRTADKCAVEIALIAGNGQITGIVSPRHLDRLGNANHAETKTPFGARIWPEESK